MYTCEFAHFGPDLLHDMIAGKQETFKAYYDDRLSPICMDEHHLALHLAVYNYT